ncbi:MAG TPA: EAL domain-containing protein [Nocardioidaceae bacterium]|nr:EAL domain-containing protein [Nocardioidaceae bacterium]
MPALRTDAAPRSWIAGRLAAAPGPLVLVTVGLSYLGLAQIVMVLSAPADHGASVWPAAGLILAALMLLPTDRWGWALAAVALAELAGDLAWGYPLGAAVGWVLCYTLGPLLGACLMRQLGNPTGELAPLRMLLLFLLGGVLVGPFVGASAGAAPSSLAVGTQYVETLFDHFVGDALGVLVVAPLLLAAHGSQVLRSRREVTALIASTALVSAVVFTDFGGAWMITMPYLLIPFFAWAALRFGPLGTAWTAVGVTAVAAVLTTAGGGPFALAGGPGGTAVMLLQIFLAITVSFALLLAAVVSDLADRRQIEETLRHQATHDPLTGLPNRACFSEALENALTGSSAQGIGLLVCDLDQFKAVNDRVGHKGGDELLVEIAERLRAGVRPHDLVARISGDEFVVLLGDVDDEAARRVALRMIGTVSRPVMIGERCEVRPSISVGAAVAAPGETSEALFRVADAALYNAKRAGRGRVVVGDEDLRLRTNAQVRHEDELPTAFAGDQLECWFQPVVDLSTGRVSAAEATVRWRHPQLGVLDAERFLPTVEAMGWGDRLFETVLTQSLRARSAWVAQSGRRPKVAVNVSAHQLGSEGLVDVVVKALAGSGVPASSLCVEVTKTTPLDEAGLASLQQLHALGVRLVLDGFGTGWSSMMHVARIPWHQVKIDRSFVAELGTDAAATDVVRGMVAMADAMGIRTGADGLTRSDQLDVLRELGCHTAQGPLFCRPETVENFGRMLAEDRSWRTGAPATTREQADLTRVAEG